MPPLLSANLKSASVQSATGSARTAIGSGSNPDSKEINNARDVLAKARSRDLSVGMNDWFNLLKEIT